MSATQASPETCGCCEGLKALTPALRDNAPELAALEYRVGTHGSFKATMLSALAGQPALRALTTREDDDSAIGVIDAWATVLDVLAFYQERIASEGFLRAATERRSVLELARAIGYELRPGVAAGTFLAFSLETAEGSPKVTSIDLGAKAQSVPGPGELPQTFETAEKIEARAAWNAIRVKSTQLVPPKFGQTTLYLKGTATDLKSGDALLIVGDERAADPSRENWDLRRVQTATAVPDADYTVVTLDRGLGSEKPRVEPAEKNPRVCALRQRAAIFGASAADWRALPDAMKASYLGLKSPDELADEDRREWPSFKIFAPLYPPEEITEQAGWRFIPPTAESVAAAVTSAAGTAATGAASLAGQAAAATAHDAALAIQAAVDTAEAAKNAVAAVAGEVADMAKQRLGRAIDDAGKLASEIASAKSDILKLAQTASRRSGDDAGKIFRDIQQSIIDSIGGVAQNLEAEKPLARIVTRAQAIADSAIADAGAIASAAVQAAAPNVADLVGTTRSFVNQAHAAVTQAAQAAGATAASALVATAVKLALEAPDPLPPPTAESVAEVARLFAGAAVDLVRAGAGPTPPTVTAALNSPVGGLLEQNIAGAREVWAAAFKALDVADAPIGGAQHVSADVHGAVDLALKLIKRPSPARRPQLKLSGDTIDLDAVYPKITSGGWVVLSIPDYAEIFDVVQVTDASRAEFLLSAKTTRLKLRGENWHRFENEVRSTTVHAQSEELPMAEQPITAPVSGDFVDLAEPVRGLLPGQLLAISGIGSATGQPISEVVTLLRGEPPDQATRLYFTTSLKHSYDRKGASLNANVVRATHGERRNEVLGSGDGAQAFQKLSLKEKPLTYVSAPTPSGAKSTLNVRVNGLLWDEVPSFYGLPPDRRAYVTRLADNGQVTVQFGDGVSGARLTTGQENITASYRVGAGLAGMVKAGQITQLLTRPLGAKAVINSEPAVGGADAEALADARRNAPLTVLTLDRIVSLADFEDFARAFAGIGKAQATWLWAGRQRLVHLTVAGASGGAVPPNSDLFRNLQAGMNAARHPQQPVEIDSYDSRPFRIVARVLVDRQHVAADVLSAVEQAVADGFSFARRSLGQAVTASEVVAVMQEVPGVMAVDLDKLYFAGQAAQYHDRLPARVAWWDEAADEVKPAELLTVHPAGIELTEMTP